MNLSIRSFALPAAVLALPLALLAQTPSSSTPTTPGATGTGMARPTESTSPSVTALPRESPVHGDVADRALSSGNSRGIAAIQRVTQDRVDRQLTAKTLIGKAVFDNQGRRVGEVKDVVLDATGAPALAGAFSHRSTQEAADRPAASRSASSSGAMLSPTPSATSMTPPPGSDYATSRSATDRSDASASGSGSRMGGTSASPSGTAGAVGSSMDQRSLSNGLASAAGWENSPAAIISSGGFLGMGDNLLRVPLNQLSYDGSNDRITLNVSQTELSSLPNPSDTAKSAAE